jgi:Putative zinc-finger
VEEFHIGDAAELYAIGALSEEESARVDAHVAQCNECLRRVGEAEETVLALERVNVPAARARRQDNVLPLRRRAASSWWIPAVAAAAFVLGFMIPHRPPQTEIATVAMLHSHFAHAQFTGAGAPVAKVLYARDRSWYYVIVNGNHRYDVYGLRKGQDTEIGSTQPRGITSDLFVKPSKRFDSIELRDAGKLVEAAAIR